MDENPSDKPYIFIKDSELLYDNQGREAKALTEAEEIVKAIKEYDREINEHKVNAIHRSEQTSEYITEPTDWTVKLLEAFKYGPLKWKPVLDTDDARCSTGKTESKLSEETTNIGDNFAQQKILNGNETSTQVVASTGRTQFSSRLETVDKAEYDTTLNTYIKSCRRDPTEERSFENTQVEVREREIKDDVYTDIGGSGDFNLLRCKKKLEANAKANATGGYVKERRRGKHSKVAVTANSEGRAQFSSAEYDAEFKRHFKLYRRNSTEENSSDNTQEKVKMREIEGDVSTGIRGSADLNIFGCKKKVEAAAKAEATASYVKERRRGKNPELAETAKSAGHAQISLGDTNVAKAEYDAEFKRNFKSYRRDPTEESSSENTQEKVIEREIKGDVSTGIRGSVDLDILNYKKKLEVNAKAEATASYVKERRRGKNPEVAVNAKSEGQAQISFGEKNAASAEYGAEFKRTFKLYRKNPTEDRSSEHTQQKVIEREIKGDVNTGIRGSADLNIFGCKKKVEAAAKAEATASYVKERRRGKNPELAETAKSAGHAHISLGDTNVAKAEYDAEFKRNFKSYRRDPTEESSSENTQEKVIEREIKGDVSTGIRGSVDLDILNCKKKLEVNAKAEATASYVKERRRGKNPEVAVNAKSEGQAQISFGERNAASAEYDAEFKRTFKSYRKNPTEDRSSENTQQKVIEREIKGDVNTGIRGSADLNIFGCKKKVEAAAKAEATASYVKERRRGKNPELAETAKSAGHAQISLGDTNVAKAEYDAEFKRNFKSYRRDLTEESSSENTQEKVIEREIKGDVSTGIRGSVDLDILNCKKKLEVNAKAEATASYVKERRRGKNPEVAVTAKSEGQAQISFGERNAASAEYDAEFKRTFKSYRKNPTEDRSSEHTQGKVIEREIKGDVNTGIRGSADLNIFGCKKKVEAAAKAEATASYVKERRRGKNPELAETAKSAGHAHISLGDTNVTKAEYDAEFKRNFKSYRRDPTEESSSENTQEKVIERQIKGDVSTGIRGSVDLDILNCKKKLEVNAKAEATASYVKERRRGKNPEVAVNAKSEGQAHISFGERNAASAEYDAEFKGTFKSYRKNPTEDRSSENTLQKVIEREIKGDVNTGIRGSADLNIFGCKKKVEAAAKAEATASYVKERRRGKNPELAETAKSAGHAQISLGATNVAKAEYDAEFKRNFKSYRRDPTEESSSDNTQEKVIEREIKGDVNTGIRGSVDLNILNCKKKLEVNAKAEATASYVKERRRGKNPEITVTAKTAGRAQLLLGEKNAASAEYDAEVKGNVKLSQIDENSFGTKKKKREFECGVRAGVQGSAALNMLNCEKKLEAKAEASADFKAGFELSRSDFTDVSSSKNGYERQIKVWQHEIKGGGKAKVRGSAELNIFNHQKKMEAEAKAGVKAKASFSAADVNIKKGTGNIQGRVKLLHGNAKVQAALKAKASLEKHSVEVQAKAEGKAKFKLLDGQFVLEAKKRKDGGIHIPGISGKIADAKVNGKAKIDISGNINGKSIKKVAEASCEASFCGGKLRALSADIMSEKDYGNTVKSKAELSGVEANICNAEVIGKKQGNTAVASAEMKGVQINAGNVSITGTDNRRVASANARTGVAVDVGNINATGLGPTGVKMEADGTVGISKYNLSIGIARETGVSLSSKFSMFNVNLTVGPPKLNLGPGAFNFGIPFLSGGSCGGSSGSGKKGEGENSNGEMGVEGRTGSGDKTEESSEKLKQCRSMDDHRSFGSKMNGTVVHGCNSIQDGDCDISDINEDGYKRDRDQSGTISNQSFDRSTKVNSSISCNDMTAGCAQEYSSIQDEHIYEDNESRIIFDHIEDMNVINGDDGNECDRDRNESMRSKPFYMNKGKTSGISGGYSSTQDYNMYVTSEVGLCSDDSEDNDDLNGCDGHDFDRGQSDPIVGGSFQQSSRKSSGDLDEAITSGLYKHGISKTPCGQVNVMYAHDSSSIHGDMYETDEYGGYSNNIQYIGYENISECPESNNEPAETNSSEYFHRLKENTSGISRSQTSVGRAQKYINEENGNYNHTLDIDDISGLDTRQNDNKPTKSCESRSFQLYGGNIYSSTFEPECSVSDNDVCKINEEREDFDYTLYTDDTGTLHEGSSETAESCASGQYHGVGNLTLRNEMDEKNLSGYLLESCAFGINGDIVPAGEDDVLIVIEHPEEDDVWSIVEEFDAEEVTPGQPFTEHMFGPGAHGQKLTLNGTSVLKSELDKMGMVNTIHHSTEKHNIETSVNLSDEVEFNKYLVSLVSKNTAKLEDQENNFETSLKNSRNESMQALLQDKERLKCALIRKYTKKSGSVRDTFRKGMDNYSDDNVSGKVKDSEAKKNVSESSKPSKRVTSQKPFGANKNIHTIFTLEGTEDRPIKYLKKNVACFGD